MDMLTDVGQSNLDLCKTFFFKFRHEYMVRKWDKNNVQLINMHTDHVPCLVP